MLQRAFKDWVTILLEWHNVPKSIASHQDGPSRPLMFFVVTWGQFSASALLLDGFSWVPNHIFSIVSKQSMLYEEMFFQLCLYFFQRYVHKEAT